MRRFRCDGSLSGTPIIINLPEGLGSKSKMLFAVYSRPQNKPPRAGPRLPGGRFRFSAFTRVKYSVKYTFSIRGATLCCMHVLNKRRNRRDRTNARLHDQTGRPNLFPSRLSRRHAGMPHLEATASFREGESWAAGTWCTPGVHLVTPRRPRS